MRKVIKVCFSVMVFSLLFFPQEMTHKQSANNDIPSQNVPIEPPY